MLSNADLREYWTRVERPKLRVLSDIACDIDGGIEATVRPTTPDAPVFVYDVERNVTIDGVEGAGPVVLAVDNLPCQLPVESSDHFGDTLSGFVPRLARPDWNRPLNQLGLPESIAGAVIAHRGELAPRYGYLREHLARNGPKA